MNWRRRNEEGFLFIHPEQIKKEYSIPSAFEKYTEYAGIGVIDKEVYVLDVHLLKFISSCVRKKLPVLGLQIREKIKKPQEER